MTKARSGNLRLGDTVRLTEVPPGLAEGLLEEDQNAIAAIIGKPLQLVGYDEDARAELKFTDACGVIHFIYVDSKFIMPHTEQ
jgi:hypothetical protein